MNGKELFAAFSYVEDKYLDMVDASEKENTDMNNRHVTLRRAVTVLIAAAISVSLLAITAMAAGWIPNIFASVKPYRNADADILEAAISATLPQNIETVVVPEIDFTQFTLYERYYNGESILLGFDLSKVMPEPIVGNLRDEALLAKIKAMPEYMHTPAEGKINDTLDLYLEIGFITQEDYDFMLQNRSENAKKHDLRKYWQITMDWQMQEELTPEQYETFWNTLEETRSCCVAIPAEPWVGDKILVNGSNFSEFIGPGLPGNFRSDYTTEVGDCIILDPIPEITRNLDSVDVELTLRSGWYYWYMELDGDVYSHFESNEPYTSVFTIENTGK